MLLRSSCYEDQVYLILSFAVLKADLPQRGLLLFDSNNTGTRNLDPSNSVSVEVAWCLIPIILMQLSKFTAGYRLVTSFWLQYRPYRCFHSLYDLCSSISMICHR